MNYAPELIGVGRVTTEVGEHLAACGHSVVVVTTPPHYPTWKVEAPYRNARYSVEARGAVKVIRCPLAVHEQIVGIRRLIAPLTSALSSAPVVIWQFLTWRPDAVLCIEPTLLCAPVALIGAAVCGSATILYVQDLEVDAGFAMGHLSEVTWLRKIALAFERFVIRGFDRVITISSKMADRLLGKGVAEDKIEVVRNWVDLDKIYPLKGPSVYREELGLREGCKVVLYSGNIGAKQGVSLIVEAARRLSHRPDIIFIVAGEGPMKAELLDRAAELQNVWFLPFQPEERMSEFLGLADVHLLPQIAAAADLLLPSKLGAMLASGRPIVVAAAEGTELANFVGNAATIVPPGDSAAFAGAIQTIVDGTSDARRSVELRLGLAGRLAKADRLIDIERVLAKHGIQPDLERAEAEHVTLPA